MAEFDSHCTRKGVFQLHVSTDLECVLLGLFSQPAVELVGCLYVSLAILLQYHRVLSAEMLMDVWQIPAAVAIDSLVGWQVRSHAVDAMHRHCYAWLVGLTVAVPAEREEINALWPHGQTNARAVYGAKRLDVEIAAVVFQHGIVWSGFRERVVGRRSHETKNARDQRWNFRAQTLTEETSSICLGAIPRAEKALQHERVLSCETRGFWLCRLPDLPWMTMTCSRRLVFRVGDDELLVLNRTTNRFRARVQRVGVPPTPALVSIGVSVFIVFHVTILGIQE